MNIRRPQNKTKKELRRTRRKLIIICFLFIIIVVNFIWIMNNDRFKVSAVEIVGNKTILDIDIEKSINHIIKKKILFVPMNNVLFVTTSRIKKKIKNDFSKIYDADVSIEDGSKLIVKVEERNPHSLWCKQEGDNTGSSIQESSILDFEEECFFADQRGYIYTRAPYFSGGVFEKIYTTNELLKIGEQILDKDEFINFFRFIVSFDDNFGVTVDHVFLNEQNETLIYINSLLNKNLEHKPYIIYHTDDEDEIVGRNMDLMITHELFKEDFEDRSGRLKFIDLRITDQIRYKFMTDEEYQKTKEEVAVRLEEENGE